MPRKKGKGPPERIEATQPGLASRRLGKAPQAAQQSKGTGEGSE